jgi:outer membrane lipoprotein-sorting protein
MCARGCGGPRVSGRKLRSSLLVLLTLGLVAGCTLAMPPPRQSVSEEARRAIDLLITRWHAFTDMRALADMVVDRGGQRQQLSGVLLAKAPGSVRFEALSPFGQPILIAVVHDERLTAFSALTNEAVGGEATAETTARLLGLPLEPQDMVAVVSGHAVPPRDIRLAEILLPDALGPSLSLVGAVSEQRIWMDFQTGIVRQLQIVGGRAAATVTYQRDDDGRLTGLDVSAAERYVTGTVRYRSLATGVDLQPESFVLTLPKDAKIQPIR